MTKKISISSADRGIDRFLDISGEVCPMTFVKTKLEIEKMAVGEILEIRLGGGEPLENLPRSVREHGHRVLDLTTAPDGITTAPHGGAPVYRLRIEKC